MSTPLRSVPLPRLRRPLALLALGAVAVLVAGACSPLVDTGRVAQDERTSVRAPLRDGGAITVGLDEEPDALDPTMSTTQVGRQVFTSMCEKLYDVDRDLGMRPQLAADMPDVSGDGREVTIPLREGVRFNDGTPFDAESVKTSLDRHREMSGSVRATELDAVEDVRVAGPHSVRLELSRPYAPLTSILADRAGMVMSPRQLDKLGEDFARHPVCVGPFEFVERVAQDRIVLRKSTHYYDADDVRLDRITYRAIPDPTIRLANLRSGQLDAMWEVAPDDVPAAAQENDIELLNQPSVQYMGLTVNVLNADGVGEDPRRAKGALARDQRVREALSLSLDRDTINDVVYGGLYQPACGPIPPQSAFATEETQACPEHDVGRARELLDEAGVDTPVSVEVLVENDPIQVRLGEVIQAMAKDAGFRVELRPTEFASAIAQAQAGDFSTFIVGWSGRPDPDGNIAQFHTKGGTNNYGGSYSPETDALIEEASTETDTAKRRDLYSELVPKLRRDNGIIYLYRERLYPAHSSDIAGMTVYPDGLMRFASAGRVAKDG